MQNPLEAVPSDAVVAPETTWAGSVIDQLRSLVDKGLQWIEPYTMEQIRTLAPWAPDDLSCIPEYARAKIQSGSVIVFPMESRFVPLRNIFAWSINVIIARCIKEELDMLFIEDGVSSSTGRAWTKYFTSSQETAIQLKNRWYTYKTDNSRGVTLYSFENIDLSFFDNRPIRAFTRSQVPAEKILIRLLAPAQLLCTEVDEAQYGKDRDALRSVLALFWSVLPKTFAKIAEILSICPDSQFRFIADPDCIREMGTRGSGRIPNESMHKYDLSDIGQRELKLHPLIRKLAESEDIEDGNTVATDNYDRKMSDHRDKYDTLIRRFSQRVDDWVYDTDKHLAHFFTLDERLRWEVIEIILTKTHFGERLSGLISLIYAHNLVSENMDPRISSELLRCIATLNSRIGNSDNDDFIRSRFDLLPLVIQNSQIGLLIKNQFPTIFNQA